MSERSRRRQAFGGVLSVVLAASCLQAQQPTVRVSGPTPVTTTTSPALPATTDAPTFQTYDLPKEMAGVIAARLQILYGSDPVVRVATENNSGRLMVYGGAKVQHEIAGRIQTLQQEIIKGNPAGANTPAIQARTYSLRNVAPRELEDAIQRLAGPRMTITTSGNGNISQVRLAGENGVQDVLQIDHQQNLVTLQGTPTMTNAWMQVVNAIDRGKASPDRPTQILPLAPADPARVEKTLRLVKAAFRPGQELNPQDDDELAAQMIPGQDPNVTVMDSMASLSSESGLFGDVQIDFVAELGLSNDQR